MNSVQLTKSGYLYILNRVTGESIYGVEERPMPQSNVPGEQTFATQPIPVKPPPMARVSYSATDIVTAADTSPEHAAACADLVENIGEIYNAGAFTPWSYRPGGTPGPTTLLFPGLVGGPNWGGAAFDPNSPATASGRWLFPVVRVQPPLSKCFHIPL